MLRDPEGLLVRLTPIRGLSKEVSRQILCCQWELHWQLRFPFEIKRLLEERQQAFEQIYRECGCICRN